MPVDGHCYACERFAGERRVCPFCGERVFRRRRRRLLLGLTLGIAVTGPFMISGLLPDSHSPPSIPLPHLQWLSALLLIGLVLIPAPRRPRWGWSPISPLLRGGIRLLASGVAILLMGRVGSAILSHTLPRSPLLAMTLLLLFALGYLPGAVWLRPFITPLSPPPPARHAHRVVLAMALLILLSAGLAGPSGAIAAALISATALSTAAWVHVTDAPPGIGAAVLLLPLVQFASLP